METAMTIAPLPTFGDTASNTVVPGVHQRRHTAEPPAENSVDRQNVTALRRLTLAILPLLWLAWVLAAVGCQAKPSDIATPTMTPAEPSPTTVPATSVAPIAQMVAHSYDSPSLGVSVPYPVDWLIRESNNGVVFGTSREVIAGGELAGGAGFVISIAPLPDTESQSVEDMCLDRAAVFASDQMEIAHPQSRTIGGQDGAALTLHGTPGLGNETIRGLVAAATWEDWAYTFVALSAGDEWVLYGPILERMLDEVRFIPRQQLLYGPDVWEPDDTTADATEIEMGSAQTHDLHAQGDRDYVRFLATRGHVYTIETADLGTSIDTKIYLYDHEGRLLAQNDDSRSVEELWASRLVWTADRTNTLYVAIQDVDDDEAGPDTTYDIRIWEEAHFVEDEFEPDDYLEKASRLKWGAAQPHNLHFAGDHDWIHFQATAGKTYIIETFDLGPSVDTLLLLFDEQGDELAMDDNGREEEEALASLIEWEAQSDALLYVMVQALNDDDAGPGTEYWLRVLETQP